MSERAGQELSAEARQLIANARGADDPTVEDEARVKARWLAGIAAGAGVSSLSEAVRAAASTGWSWGMKAAVLAGAAAVAAVGVYLGWPEAEPHRAEAPLAESQLPRRQASAEVPVEPAVPASAPLPEAAVPHGSESSALERQAAPAPAPAPAVSPTPARESPQPSAEAPASEAAAGDESVPAEPGVLPAAEAPAPRAASARQARSRAGRSKPSSKPAKAATKPPVLEQAAQAPATAATTGQLGEEIARLSEIREQLQAGSPSRALELLTEYRSRFEEPNLAMEADALQVDALCKAGKRDAAREAAAAFASRWPASPLQQRVSSACQ